MKGQKATSQAFQFVPVDASKAERRRLVRSNAANYQWSRQKRRPGKPYKENRAILTSISEDNAPRTTDAHPADELDVSDQLLRLDSESGALTLGSEDREKLVPLLATYADLILLPENGIGPLMKFSKWTAGDLRS